MNNKVLIGKCLIENHQFIKKNTMKRKITISEAKQISLIEFFEKIGLFPQKVIGNDYWYLSPFRKEKTPSLKANTVLNVWYDHGIGEGGTIIDFGIKLFNCSISDLLVRLSDNNFSFHQPIITQGIKNDSKIEITEIRTLSNANLINYIKERRIQLKNAQKYCKEVHFKLNGKQYYSIGFPNNSGGFELRNKHYKSCVSPKDLTYITLNHKILCVFEGFFDFLSFFQLDDKPEPRDFLILNSLAFMDKALNYFNNYEKVYLFLDNDSAGNSAKKRILQLGLSSIEDLSQQYIEHKDLNSFLIDSDIKMEKENGKDLSLSL